MELALEKVIASEAIERKLGASISVTNIGPVLKGLAEGKINELEAETVREALEITKPRRSPWTTSPAARSRPASRPPEPRP
jgi:hypothetical protein